MPGPQPFLPSCGGEMKAFFPPVGYVLSGQELTTDPGGTSGPDSPTEEDTFGKMG